MQERIGGFFLVDSGRLAGGELTCEFFGAGGKGAIVRLNGLRTLVPPHITAGTRIVVMTADGSYVERAKD
jgi:Elongation factor P, C-terminal